MCTLVQKEDKNFLHNGECTILSRQRCQRSRSNYRYKNRGRWTIKLLTTLAAIIMYQSLPKDCVVKVVKEDGNKNCSQDNLRLERTKCNTLKQACLWKPRVICRRGTLTQCHQRVAIGWARICKDKQYIQRIKEFSSMMLSRHRHIMTKEVNKNINRNMYMYVDSWSLPNNSIIHTMHVQNNQNDTKRCIIFGFYAWDDVALTQQPKAVVLQSRTLFAWIEEADQNPQIFYVVMILKKPKWPILILHNWKGSTQRQEIKRKCREIEMKRDQRKDVFLFEKIRTSKIRKMS